MEFIAQVWQTLTAALTFDAAQLEAMLAAPLRTNEYTAAILTVALLAGISELLGDSVVWFVNRVRPARFFVSLALNGILFVVKLLFWAFTIWLVARVIFNAERALGDVFLAVCLGSAPFVLGVFIFLPYLGQGLRWVLSVYSWLLTVLLVALEFQFGIAAAIVCTLGGWLLIQIADALLARPREVFQDWMWRKTTGAPPLVAFDEQSAELARRLSRNADA
jgi:hypothetical protein